MGSYFLINIETTNAVKKPIDALYLNRAKPSISYANLVDKNAPIIAYEDILIYNN